MIVSQLISTVFPPYFLFIIGASIGSFLNVLINRLPKNQSILGRSHCDFCRKKIAWYDLIPVFSFFVLKGRSRCCRKKLLWQYPLIELFTGFIFVIVFKDGPYISSSLIRSVLTVSIISCLIVIFVSDLKYHLISDYIQAAFFIFSVFYHLTINFNQFLVISINFLISGLIVSFPIFLIYFLSKERAMGLGDVFLAANIGFLLGWQSGFLALYIAFVTGAFFGLITILFKNKKLKSRIPFGPFLVIGTIIILFWGKEILEIIKRVYGF